MNSNIKESRLGLFAMLAWCVVSAFADVFTGAMASVIDPTLLCFGIFFYASLFFLILNVKNLTLIYQKIVAHFKTVVKINVATFAIWYLTIYPLKFIEPSIVGAIILATMPIATLIMGALMNYDKKLNKQNVIISILLFVGIIFLAIIVLNHKSGIQHFSFLFTLLSLIGCVAAGVALAINSIYTKRLSKEGFSPFDILTFRFILTVLITGVLAHKSLPEIFHHAIGWHIVILAFMLIIIPQTFFQYALRELEPITTAIIAPLKPVLVFPLELLNRELILTPWTILGVAYLSIVSIGGTLIQYKRIALKKLIP